MNIKYILGNTIKKTTFNHVHNHPLILRHLQELNHIENLHDKMFHTKNR